MSGDLGSLVISLTAETAQFKDALTKSAYQMDQSVGQMVTATKSLEASIASVDGALGNFGISLRNVLGMAAAGGLLELANHAIEAAAHVELLSQKTGIAAGQLAAMKASATAGGVALDDVAQASVKLSKNIETGSTKSATALEAMGLSMEDLKKKSPAEMMQVVAQRFNEFADGAGKSAAAQLLFGKSGADILPFLKNYGAQLQTNKVGYDEFAKSAHEFEVGLQKLKAASQGIVNHWVAEALPVLIALVNGIDRVKNVIIAAVVVFGGLPLVTMAATVAYGALSSAMAANAIAAELGMVQTSLFTTSLWGTTLAAQAATGAVGILAIAGGVLFAAYAGWQVGSWLSEQFLEAKLAGIALVEGLLTGWEYVKYGAQVAWEAIKGAFSGAVNIMREDFAQFISNIGKGFEFIGKGDVAAAMQKLADSVRPAVSATEGFIAAEKKLAAERDSAVKAIKDITGAMADDAITNNAATKAKDDHAKAQIELTDAVKAAKDPAQDFLDKLAEQVATLGLSAEGLIRYKAAQFGVTEQATPLISKFVLGNIAIDEQKRALSEATTAYKNYTQSQQKAYEELTKTVATWVSGNAQLRTQNETMGLSKVAINLLAAAWQLESDAQKAALTDDVQEREHYLEALKILYAARVKMITDGAEKRAMLDVIEEERKAMVAASEATSKTFKETSDSIDKYLSDAFTSGFKHGKTIAEDFKAALINMFNKLVLKPILQPVGDFLAGIYQQGTSALSGIFGAAGLFGAGAAGANGPGTQTIAGGGTSAFGLGGSALGGSWAGALGGAALGGAITSQYGSHSAIPGVVAGGIIGYAATAGIAAVGGLAVAAGSAAGALSAVAAAAVAVPVIGWIVAAIAIIASFAIKPGGGPKTGGSAYANYNADGVLSLSRGGPKGSGFGSQFYTPNDRDSDLNKFVSSIGDRYRGTIAALGGKASAVSFGMGYDMDPSGTAPNRLGASVGVNGQQVYGFRDRDLGRDPATLTAAMSVEASRMLLAAVQASDLPADVAKLLNGLMPAALGSEQISNVLSYAAAFHSLPQIMKDGLAGITGLEINPETSIELAKFGAAYSAVQKVINADPSKDTQAILDQANMTALDKFHAQGAALSDMAKQFDGSATAALNLAQATATYYNNMVQLLVALEQSTATFHKSIQDMKQSFLLETLSSDDKRSFYQADLARQRAVLDAAAANPSSADPANTANAAAKAKQDLLDWWNLQSTADKTNSLGWFTAQLDSLDAQLEKANKAISDSIKAANDPSNPNSPIGQVKGAFDAFMLDMTKWLNDNRQVSNSQTNAAGQMVDAANTMSTAANTQLTAANTPIVVTVNNGGPGEAGQ